VSGCVGVIVIAGVSRIAHGTVSLTIGAPKDAVSRPLKRAVRNDNTPVKAAFRVPYSRSRATCHTSALSASTNVVTHNAAAQAASDPLGAVLAG
jgi:hypothetical protein